MEDGAGNDGCQYVRHDKHGRLLDGCDTTAPDGCAIPGASALDTTALHVAGIVERLRHTSAPPSDTPWGVRMFRVLDPDGLELTIASERER